jgi:hypothetical protein
MWLRLWFALKTYLSALSWRMESREGEEERFI